MRIKTLFVKYQIERTKTASILFLLLLFFFFSSSIFAQNKKQLSTLDKYYEKTLKDFAIPGMAIAIVSNNEIVFAKGYGYSNIQDEKKVDENTLFAIASNSKAFTAMALAQLVDQKRLSWKDKVVDYLPYFSTYSDYVTQAFTIEDLLCHRSGLKTFSGDLLWYASILEPREIIEASAHLTPEYGFREKFGYSNIHYLAAGLILEEITDTSWADYVQFHFLDPLKMARTQTTTSNLATLENVAQPYYHNGEKNVEVNWVNWDNIAPAGAIISSVKDYAEWIKLVIHRGSYDGKQYLSDESFEKMASMHIVKQLSESKREAYPSTHFDGYGLGFSLKDYHGYKILSHGGGYDGMISKSCFVPEKKLGFIILTNNLNWATGSLMNKTLDVLLNNDLMGKDWASSTLAYKEKKDKEKRKKLEESEVKRGKIGARLFELSAYTGRYHDEMYGDVVVWEENEKLNFKMVSTPIFNAQLLHWNLNTFTFKFQQNLSSLPEGKLWFELDKNGEIISLKIDVPNPDFYFTEFNFIKQND